VVKLKAPKKEKTDKKPKEKRKKVNFNSAEYRIRVVRDYCRLWSDFFRAFAEGLHDRKIYEGDEQSFFQIVSLLAMNHYRFEMMAGEYFKDPDKIIKEVLGEAVNLSSLKNLSEAQFSKLEVDWHSVFIGMNKCVGKLLGTLPPEKAEQLSKCP
jgi:hypothetical protein